jgi:hypothetical protein
MNNGTFDFNLFIAESKETLLNPKSYFSTLKTAGGLVEPLIKAAIYGALAGVILFLWGVLGFGVGGGSIFGGAVGIMAFFWSIIASIIGLFVGGVVVLILSSICKGNTDFEACVRVTASLMVLMPISALLGFTMGINLYLGLLIGLVVKLYGLWLIYHALIETLKGKPETAKTVSYVLIALMVLFLLGSLSAKNRATRFLDKYNKDSKELLEELNKN